MKQLMRIATTLAAVGILAILAQPANAESEKAKAADKGPDATVKLSGGSVGVGVGFSWGSGVLTYKGKDYPFSVDGLSAGSVGASSVEATGDVYGLKKLSDFNGNYTATAAGATVGGGGGAVTMRNQHGVSMQVVATTQGVQLSLSVSGVKVKLKK
ncbi:MAG TPA: DUF1134 domain-containing protein [Candidatus Kryptonia bacterium]|nr:DUF1134 domain-containing protein [Candidatus Kryptonia bacterium]